MCKNGPKGAHQRTKAKKSHNLPRPLERQDDILGCVITGDETWVYQYDPEMKRQVHNGRLPLSHNQKSSISPNQESKHCC